MSQFFTWVTTEAEMELHYGRRVLAIAFIDTDGMWTWVVSLERLETGQCADIESAKSCIVNEVCS